MPGNGNVENSQARVDDVRAHQNSKSGEQGHDVQQARADDSSTVVIENQHGSNVVANSGQGGDKAHTHANQGDGHSATQARTEGSHVVLIENAHGMNAVIHIDGVGVEHVNTMHDGWVI